MFLLRKVCYGFKVGYYGFILEFYGWIYLKFMYWYYNLYIVRFWLFRFGLLIDFW